MKDFGGGGIADNAAPNRLSSFSRSAVSRLSLLPSSLGRAEA